MNEINNTSDNQRFSYVASDRRYSGLIDMPVTTKIHQSLINLFNYFDIFSFKSKLLYKIVSILRFMQLIGSALMVSNKKLYGNGTLSYNSISIISIFMHVLPTAYRANNEYIILSVISSIILFHIALIGFSILLYNSSGNLGSYLIIIHNIIISITPFLLFDIGGEFVGELVSSMIADSNNVKKHNIATIVVFLLSYLIYTVTITKAFMSTLVFRPLSFQSLEFSTNKFLLHSTIVATMISAVASELSKIPALVLIALTWIPYSLVVKTLFGCGTFIEKDDQMLVLAGAFSCFVFSVVSFILLLINKSYNDYFIVFLVGVIFVSIVISFFIIKNREAKDLRILDDIEEQNDITIISKRKFKQIVISGFANCHPTCIDFSIFKLAIAQWDDDISIWEIFAKFSMIYPELTYHLEFIGQSISKLKDSDEIIKNISGIMKTRETSMTPQLKSAISKINKSMNKTLTRIRNIWDLVLQGSVSELPNAIKIALDSSFDLEFEITHLMIQYPNNKYVFRQYLAYLNDVKNDLITAKTIQQSVNKLQRGIHVNQDIIKQFGILAFPNIPGSIQCSQQDVILGNASINENEEEVQLIDESDDLEVFGTLSNQIEKQHIPAIKFIIWSTVVAFLIVVFVPLLFFTLYFEVYTTILTEPIPFMQGFSYTRNMFSMVSSATERYMLEVLDDPHNLSRKIMEPMELAENFPSNGYNGAKSSWGIADHIRSITTYCLSFLNGLRDFKPGNEDMEDIRRLIFSSIVNFTSFDNNQTAIYHSKSSVPDILYINSVHTGNLLAKDQITNEDLLGPDYMTMMNNIVNSMAVLNQASVKMVDYMTNESKRNIVIFDILLGCLILFALIVYPVIYSIQYRLLSSNRNEILNTLTTLPKSVLSNISNSFNKISKSDSMVNSNEELNRQEESIIKLFNSVSDNLSKTKLEVNNFFCVVFILIFTIVGYIISYFGYSKAAKVMLKSSSHLDNLFGVAAYIYGGMGCILKLSIAHYSPIYSPIILNETEDIDSLSMLNQKLVTCIHKVLFGGESSDEPPFPDLNKVTEYANEYDLCDNKSAIPTDFLHSVHCFTIMQQLFFAVAGIKKILSNLLLDNKIYPNPTDPNLRQLWQYGPIEVYDILCYTAGLKFVDSITIQINEKRNEQRYTAIAMIVLSTLLTAFMIFCTLVESKILKLYLKLFLKAPLPTILSNQKVMNVISGNYSNFKREDSGKHNILSDEIVNTIDDVIIVINEDKRKILSVNDAFINLFGLTNEEIVDKNVDDFFTQERFGVEFSLEKLYKSTIQLVFNCPRTKSDGYVEFSSLLVGSKRIIFGRNNTQNYLHEMLIEEEKRKTDRMLASILPPCLVARVQNGEKNISFAVQSATILFLDIVEFTPWCGSHEAGYVMNMLNMMFKDFDAITNAHKTMTKIKCIGDCYMAAGGIFDDVNHPAVHAKEVVDFGTKVIKALEKIDEETNEKLRIRVGINTGGPIVAGVIGTEKPTFEILGPAINIAHEMESHGIPMKVHISRPVYELIYGQQFDIKERGEIEIKHGKMFTYIVEP